MPSWEQPSRMGCEGTKQVFKDLLQHNAETMARAGPMHRELVELFSEWNHRVFSHRAYVQWAQARFIQEDCG
jgi:hypothetical protein